LKLPEQGEQAHPGPQTIARHRAQRFAQAMILSTSVGPLAHTNDFHKFARRITARVRGGCAARDTGDTSYRTHDQGSHW
jgi:hypothetical protein